MASELEQELHAAMLATCRRAVPEIGHAANYLMQVLGEHGGCEAARTMINREAPSVPFTALWKRGRLDLSVEALVVGNSKWHELFEPEELARARRRLSECGYGEKKEVSIEPFL